MGEEKIGSVRLVTSYLMQGAAEIAPDAAPTTWTRCSLKTSFLTELMTKQTKYTINKSWNM